MVCSIFFCLSLNHKQMGLFYAPAFFAHLLGRCMQRSTVAGKVRGVALHAAIITRHPKPVLDAGAWHAMHNTMCVCADTRI